MICPSCGSEIPDGSKSCFICGEPLATRTNSPGGNTYGSEYYTDREMFPNIPQPGEADSDSNTSKILIIIFAVLLLFFLVILVIKGGLFVNKNGVYRSDDLKEAFTKLMEAEGYGNNPILDQIDYICTLTVNGLDCEIYMCATFGGEPIYERKMAGTISFFGNSVTIKYNNIRGEKGTYDPVNKTISFSIKDSEAAKVGLENLTFKLEE